MTTLASLDLLKTAAFVSTLFLGGRALTCQTVDVQVVAPIGLRLTDQNGGPSSTSSLEAGKGVPNLSRTLRNSTVTIGTISDTSIPGVISRELYCAGRVRNYLFTTAPPAQCFTLNGQSIGEMPFQFTVTPPSGGLIGAIRLKLISSIDVFNGFGSSSVSVSVGESPRFGNYAINLGGTSFPDGTTTIVVDEPVRTKTAMNYVAHLLGIIGSFDTATYQWFLHRVTVSFVDSSISPHYKYGQGCGVHIACRIVSLFPPYAAPETRNIDTVISGGSSGGMVMVAIGSQPANVQIGSCHLLNNLTLSVLGVFDSIGEYRLNLSGIPRLGANVYIQALAPVPGLVVSSEGVSLSLQ